MKLINTDKLKNLINKDDFIVLAVSTGIDSMSLFHFLYNEGYKIIVAHVNHKRRVESDSEYIYLKDLCAKLNVIFEGYTIDENIKSNFQEEARYIRYNFFKQVADKYNTKVIISAHQADDEIETILMRLTRGSSYKGYGGIREITKDGDYLIIRPLINTLRSTIEEYQKENNIKYFEDSSNSTDHYTRNVVRHNVIPHLKSINPSIINSINNFKEDMLDSYDYLKNYLDKNMDLLKVSENDVSIKLSILNSFDRFIQKGFLYRMLNIISNNSVELHHERINEILSITKAKESKIIEITDEILVTNEYSNLVFYKKIDRKDVNLLLDEIKTYKIPGKKVVLSQKYHLLPNIQSYMMCYNNLDDIMPLSIRNIEKGDKITINNITKNVYDVLKDEKVPKRFRENTLVLLSKGEIVYIENLKRKETDTSLKNKLYITIEEDKNED